VQYNSVNQFPPPPFTLPLLFQLSGKEETAEETVACSDSEAEVDPEEEPPSKRFHYLKRKGNNKAQI